MKGVGFMLNQTNRPTNKAAEEIIQKYFPVLDSGFISLIDYSGTDQCIERAARVSYGGGGTRKVSDTNNLLRYLHRHNHSTPLEMIDLKFHCCAPIFIMRQWIRHRISSTNEMSGRYSLMPMMFYLPEKEQFQLQNKNNKQGRGNDVDLAIYNNAKSMLQNHRAHAVDLYSYMTGEDVAREIARIDLPLSTYTQWYWKINLRSLFNFLTLRTDSHAQWEIRQYANIIAGMVKRVAPLSYDAWLDYDVCGERFSHQELEIIRSLLKTDDNGVFTNGDRISPLPDTISKRERDELIEKLQPKEKPDFELDLSQAKSPDFFEKKMSDAVPPTLKE